MENHQTSNINLRGDIFTVVVDFQLQKLNSRFEHIIELLILNAALSPKEAYKLFEIDCVA